jgi:hypothetical protein
MALSRTEERILGHILDLMTATSALASAVAVAAQSVQNREQKRQILSELEKVNGLTEKLLSGVAITAQGDG